MRKFDRYAQLAIAAAQEALNDSGLVIDDSNRDRVGVLIGTGIGGIGTMMENVDVLYERGPERVSPFLVPMMIVDSAAGLLAIRTGARGRKHGNRIRLRHRNECRGRGVRNDSARRGGRHVGGQFRGGHCRADHRRVECNDRSLHAQRFAGDSFAALR